MIILLLKSMNMKKLTSDFFRYFYLLTSFSILFIGFSGIINAQGNYDAGKTKKQTDTTLSKIIYFKSNNLAPQPDYLCNMMNCYILDINGDTVTSWKTYGNNSNICPLCVNTTNHPFPYTIYSKFTDEGYLNGVTTLDIVIIIKNILENRKFPVCDIITMDINNDLYASVSDIIMMYRDVFGLSNNTDNIWMAYDKKLDTPKPFFPLQIENIPDTAIEFTLIKKLDLGYPHNYSIFCDTIDILNNEYRNNYLSNDTVVLDIVNTGNEANVHSFEIQYNGDKPIHGFQISMQFDNNNVEDIKVYNQQGQELGLNEYIVLNNEVRILALSPRGILNNLSYTVKVTSKNNNIEDLKYLIDFNKNPLRLEATDEHFNSTPLKFNFRSKPNANKELTYDDIAINPNPFTCNLYISLDNSTGNTKKIVIYNLLGKKIFEKKYILNMEKEIIVPSNVFPDKGIYLVEIDTGQTKVVKKVIRN